MGFIGGTMKKILVFLSLLLCTQLYGANIPYDNKTAGEKILSTEWNGALSAAETYITTLENNRVLKAGDTTTGTMTSSGVALDQTTGTNEDYTITPNGTGNVVITTTDTATTGATNNGLQINKTSDAIVTGTNQNLYGITNTLTKTGADTSVDTTTLQGVRSIVSNTGSTNAGTKNTYGLYSSATGDANGTSTAYGIYATATGADTNYAGYFSGNVTSTGTVTGATVTSTGAVNGVTGVYSGAVGASNYTINGLASSGIGTDGNHLYIESRDRIFLATAGHYNYLDSNGNMFIDGTYNTFSPKIDNFMQEKGKTKEQATSKDYLDWALVDAKKPHKPYDGCPRVKDKDSVADASKGKFNTKEEVDREIQTYGKDISKIAIGTARWAEDADKRIKTLEDTVELLKQEIAELKKK